MSTIESLLQHCKEQTGLFLTSNLIMLCQTQYQHSDFLTVSFILHALGQGKKVTFIGLRENYAHFVSLSKKLGKSIEGYLKNKSLKYVECFQSQFCSELPLLETQPNTYVPPPTHITKIYLKDLIKETAIFHECDLAVVDSIGYIEDKMDLCFWLYERAAISGCRLLLGGCSNEGEVTDILAGQAQLVIQLQNDVGGFGKLKLMSQNKAETIMWKSTKGQIEFSKQITI